MADNRTEKRNPNPQNAHREAFLRGWSDAVREKEPRIYKAAFDPQGAKTHQNMGNLFGWIYGRQPINFRLETWYRYMQTLEKGK